MATIHQIAANRRNTQHSTGPRTKRGKAIASQNAARHGLYATSPVIRRLEDPGLWEQHRTATINSFAPRSPLEQTLAEYVAHILWRLGRVTRYEHHVTAISQDRAPDDLASRRSLVDILDTPSPDNPGPEHIKKCIAAARLRLRALPSSSRLSQTTRSPPPTGRPSSRPSPPSTRASTLTRSPCPASSPTASRCPMSKTGPPAACTASSPLSPRTTATALNRSSNTRKRTSIAGETRPAHSPAASLARSSSFVRSASFPAPQSSPRSCATKPTSCASSPRPSPTSKTSNTTD